ncbi:hypothetical protein BC962_2813 [Gillisia mitskevichiae]|uniref:Uncharacterized protein n=1 Tax=Gillisia mitskevichiae TaxID=270921 RepID=A0A495P4I7_9FLAO|nr:hypothetical protein BC962_2813 [Gillisia mitskevichiae]
MISSYLGNFAYAKNLINFYDKNYTDVKDVKKINSEIIRNQKTFL